MHESFLILYSSSFCFKDDELLTFSCQMYMEKGGIVQQVKASNIMLIYYASKITGFL